MSAALIRALDNATRREALRFLQCPKSSSPRRSPATARSSRSSPTPSRTTSGCGA